MKLTKKGIERLVKDGATLEQYNEACDYSGVLLVLNQYSEYYAPINKEKAIELCEKHDPHLCSGNELYEIDWHKMNDEEILDSLKENLEAIAIDLHDEFEEYV